MNFFIFLSLKKVSKKNLNKKTLLFTFLLDIVNKISLKGETFEIFR